jgi:hypothetical protein
MRRCLVGGRGERDISEGNEKEDDHNDEDDN